MRWRKSHIVYIDVRWMALKVLAVILVAAALTTYLKWTRINLIEFESTDLASSWQISDRKVIENIHSALDQAEPVQGERPLAGGITMRLISQRETREYIFAQPGYVYDPKKARLLRTTEKLSGVLRQAEAELRKRSPFGEQVQWEEVQSLFPVGSEAKVTDLDSGRVFSVRRTGGYSHADVEPLAARDTVTVKNLYGGVWSWKRRAVVVEMTGNRKLAASLTGMPHGKGELKDNDCYGSIGLYFCGKLMEKSSNLSHLIMIWKSAGKTREMLRGLSPEETLLVLFTALDQRDLQTLEQVVARVESRDRAALDSVIGVTVTGLRKKAELTYQVTASVSLRKGPYNHRRQVLVHLSRDRNLGIYKVDGAFLAALFRP